MTKEQYEIYVRTLPEDGQNAFRFKGIRYFINSNLEGWNIYRVSDFIKGNLSSKDKFETIKIYPNVEELVSDKIFDGKSLNEIFAEIEYADF